MSSATTCPACEISGGRRSVPGGILLAEGGLVLHALDGPSPLPGWLVLTAARHCRAIHDLDEEAAAALGPLARRVARAQREALGAEHVYLFAIGDLLHHFHLHLVPRYADTPARLRGRGAFEAAPGDALSAPAVEAAVARVAAALRR